MISAGPLYNLFAYRAGGHYLAAMQLRIKCSQLLLERQFRLTDRPNEYVRVLN